MPAYDSLANFNLQFTIYFSFKLFLLQPTKHFNCVLTLLEFGIFKSVFFRLVFILEENIWPYP